MCFSFRIKCILKLGAGIPTPDNFTEGQKECFSKQLNVHCDCNKLHVKVARVASSFVNPTLDNPLTMARPVRQSSVRCLQPLSSKHFCCGEIWLQNWVVTAKTIPRTLSDILFMPPNLRKSKVESTSYTHPVNSYYNTIKNIFKNKNI